MVEPYKIQLRGFHNTCDESGNIIGFQFEVRSKYYKGLWLSQMRVGDVTVDGVVYDRDTVIWNINGMDYTRQEMFDRQDVYWQLNDTAIIKIKKPGGLEKGYHEVFVAFGWVSNYNGAKEKEYDGSGLGNAGTSTPERDMRRMLLAR